MDNRMGDDVRSGRANRRLGLFDETPGMADATLVPLRVENDGSQDIDRDDHTGSERHGPTAVFTDRTVRGVSVTQPSDADHLRDHFTAERGFGYEGNRLRVPRVPLNRGDHFKLLVLLSGGDVGGGIRLTGGIRGRREGRAPARPGLDGEAASVDALERGTSAYPYREIEYAYTYGRPPAGSLASSFLSYRTRGNGQNVVRTHGHVPCWTPEGLRLCA